MTQMVSEVAGIQKASRNATAFDGSIVACS
jgi:hypothetical protein